MRRVSIWHSVGELVAVPARDNYTGEPVDGVTHEIDCAVSPLYHDLIRVSVFDPDVSGDVTVLLSCPEARTLIDSLTSAITTIVETTRRA